MKEIGKLKVLIVDVANVESINNELEAAGQGPDFFSVPLCDNSKAADTVTHYGCSVSLTTAHEKSIEAILVKYGVVAITEKFKDAILSSNVRLPKKKVKEGFKHDAKKQK